MKTTIATAALVAVLTLVPTPPAGAATDADREPVTDWVLVAFWPGQSLGDTAILPPGSSRPDCTRLGRRTTEIAKAVYGIPVRWFCAPITVVGEPS